MTRTAFALVLTGSIAFAAGGDRVEPAEPATAASSDYERALIEAEAKFLKRKVAAHERYVRSLADAKRDALAAGELDQARRLDDKEQEIRARLKVDRDALVAKRHELLSPAVVAVRGEGFELKVLRVGATAYSNRDYKWRGVPKAIDGWRFTQIAGGDTPEIRVDVERPGIVYAMAEGAELKEAGWMPHDGLSFHWYPDRPPMTVFGKSVEAGEVVEIPHHGWTGTIVLLPPEATVDAHGEAAAEQSDPVLFR